jgi:hypothetical protein
VLDDSHTDPDEPDLNPTNLEREMLKVAKQEKLLGRLRSADIRIPPAYMRFVEGQVGYLYLSEQGLRWARRKLRLHCAKRCLYIGVFVFLVLMGCAATLIVVFWLQ